MFKNLSIKNKIVVTILIVSSFTSLLGFSIIILKNIHDMKSTMLAHSLTNARLLGDESVTALSSDSPERADEVLQKLKSIPEYTDGHIYNEFHQLFASYSKSGKLALFPFQKGEVQNRFDGGDLHIYQPIIYQDHKYGYIYLKRHTVLTGKIINLVLLVVLLMVGLLAVTYILASRFQKIISAPILNLAGITGKISSSKDYSLRIEKEHEDEIGILYDGFNSMLDVIVDKEQERDRAEEQIKASLNEKVILLKEVHHRVKNNMQVISSMLSLQSEYIKEEEDRRLFRNSQERILSMAMVHEMLYRSNDFTKIGFQNYITELTSRLRNTYLRMENRIAITIKAENIFLGIDIAIPCALIINELISNSMKYGFPDDMKGEIAIDFCLENDDQYHLKVADNGVGIKKVIDIQNSETLGFRLVNALTEQISGTLNMETENGTVIDIVFQISADRA